VFHLFVPYPFLTVKLSEIGRFEMQLGVLAVKEYTPFTQGEPRPLSESPFVCQELILLITQLNESAAILFS
jgi:hypothetical protein